VHCAQDGLVILQQRFRQCIEIFVIPGDEVSSAAELYVESSLLLKKSEHLLLPRPLGGHIAKAGNSHAIGKPSLNGGFD
jgi:hypothetical protein